MRWTRDHDEVRVRRPRAGGHHVFISHAWRSGQDQAKTIKLVLLDLLPQLDVFLDVDTALTRDAPNAPRSNSFKKAFAAATSTDNDWMNTNVKCSTTMIAVLTGGANGESSYSHYFQSKNCMYEMRSAIANWQQSKGKRRIILVIETDLDHGGIAFDAHKKDCWHNDKDVYNALFEYGSGSYV